MDVSIDSGSKNSEYDEIAIQFERSVIVRSSFVACEYISVGLYFLSYFYSRFETCILCEMYGLRSDGN